jgi:BCD family chlorophyll transporter-like MFS transporter
MGKHRATRLGCMATAVCFALVIGSGVIENANLLLTAVFIFGISSGILTNGAISLMLDLTAAETAGTFIGAWGLSQALAQAIATVTGGALLDLGRWLFATPLLAYSLVFFLEALAMLLALWLLSRVNVREFQRDTQKTISTVLEGELE